MLSRSAEFSRRAVGWLLPAALLALTPKCLLCLLAYAGIGAALGLGGPEICGATAGSPGSWAKSIALLGVGAATVGSLASLRRRRNKSPAGRPIPMRCEPATGIFRRPIWQLTRQIPPSFSCLRGPNPSRQALDIPAIRVDGPRIFLGGLHHFQPEPGPNRPQGGSRRSSHGL